ncbi:two-component regulator propeller domain-containing protein [Bacteroidota bacterium]
MRLLKRGNPIILFNWLLILMCWVVSGELNAQSLIIKSAGESELANSTINDIEQDQLGYLWIGTSKGLYRYNGLDFDEIELQTGYDTEKVNCLFIDSHNTLWIGRSGGITGYDGTTINEFDTGGEEQVQITNINEDIKGDIWFSSGSGKLYKTDSEGKIHAVNSFSEEVSSLAVDREGNILFGTANGRIIRADNDEYVGLCQLDNISAINSICVLPHNGILIGTSHGLYEWISGSGLKQPELVPGSENLQINQITFSDTDSLWIGANSGLYQLTGNKIIEIDKKQGFGIPDARTVFSDREGNLWIGTGTYGLFRHYGRRFLFLNKGRRPESRITRFINRDSGGRLWIGYFGDGLEIYDGESTKSYTLSNGFISDYIRNSYQDSNGTMWVVTTRGVAHFQKDKINFYNASDGLANNYCYQITEDSEGDIWIATVSGLSLFDGDDFSTYSVGIGMSSDRIEHLLPIEDGSMLVSTEGGIDLIKNRQVTNLFSIQELKGRVVSYMARNSNNEVWCGTTDNVILKLDLEDHQIVILDDMGIRGKITFLTFDHSNRMIIGMKNEIMICSIKENKIISRTVYGSNAGMNVSEINTDAFFLDHDNKLWIGTENGSYIYNPDIKELNNDYPVVAITTVNIPEREYDWSHHSDSIETWHNVPVEFTVPFSQNDFIFRFQGISLNQSEGIIYRCMLEGHETSWSKSFSDNFITYNNLPSGKYNFRIQGSFDGINWGGPDTTIQFQIIPPFYGTIWFYMVILSILLLLFILYNNYRIRLRIQQIVEIEHARVAESEKIRKKVAMDFHDEVGNQLTGISMLAQLISRKSQEMPSEMSILLQKIDLEARKLFQGTKDFIWSIDPNNDNLKEVYYNIRDYGEDLFDNSGIMFHTQNGETDSLNIKLPAGYSRQMVLIFKEGLQNTVNCPGCRNVYFSMFAQSEAIEIKLKADGEGIAQDNLDYGEGLKKMKERSQKLKSDLIVNSNDKEGTEIVLKVTFPDKTVRISE